MNSAKNAPQAAKLTPNLGLKHRNSFGLDSTAELAYEITSPDQLPALMQALNDKKLRWRALGGGSNVILPESLPGATLLINILGQEIIRSDEEHSWLSVGAGVNWHEFVSWALENHLPGFENLALIPGTVGAAPIQNIGAYGQEVSSTLVAVEFLDRYSQEISWIPAAELGLGYRDSIFKRGREGIVLTVELALTDSSTSTPIAFAQLASALGVELGAQVPLAQVRNTVWSLRAAKGMVLADTDAGFAAPG